MILKNYSSAMDNDQNIGALLKEMDWLRCVIDQVIKTYLLQEGHENDWEEIPLPDLMEDDSVYSKCVNEWALNKYQRLALSLAMASHLSPEILDVFFGKNGIYDRGFTEFGGVTDKNHSGFLPTVQTLYFLLSATNSSLRVVANKLLSKENILIREQVLFVSLFLLVFLILVFLIW